MLTRLELLPPAPPHLHSEPALIIAISRPPKTMAFTLENFSGSLWTTLPALLIAFVLSAYVFKPVNPPPPASPMTDPLPKTTSADASAGTSTDGTGEKKAFAVPDALPPPKDEQFTLEDLKKFDGTDASLPIYLSIKGARYLVYSYTPQLTAPIPSYCRHRIRRQCKARDIWARWLVQRLCWQGRLTWPRQVVSQDRGRRCRLEHAECG